jgi:protoporphyrinogen/coproporphyrinogen III oxidase
VGYAEKVVIIGAGISGLACAYRLRQLGVSCVVLEAASRPGGVIATERRNGFLFEAGPQCPRFSAPVWEMMREVGLDREFVAGDPKAKRYVLRNGDLHRAPFSPGGLLTTGLVSTGSKLRILTEVFSSSAPPATEETLAAFVRRKFGSEILDNLVDPIVSTVFLGDAEKMGMQSAFPALVDWERGSGSLVRGAIRARNRRSRSAVSPGGQPASSNGTKRSLRVTDSLPPLGSFRTGMAALPEHLAAYLGPAIRYDAKVASLASGSAATMSGAKLWRIVTAVGETLIAQNVILAVPSHAAGSLLDNVSPNLAGLLEEIEYAPLCVVSAAYERSSVKNSLDGFGFMVPRREGLRTICTFWNSSLFSGRAPQDRVLITSFARMNDPQFGTSAQEIGEQVHHENARILGISAAPVERQVWSNEEALPQYNVGHAERVSKIAQALRQYPNLQVIGSFLRGRSIGDCVDVAFAAADDLYGRIGGSEHPKD